MKYNLEALTFCVFVRIDNDERAENLKAMVEFYRHYGDNVKFIFAEDGKVPKVPVILEFTNNDVYTFHYNDSEWNKCEGYNKCIKLSKTNTLVFNDVDAIIHPQQLLDSHDQLCEVDNAGLIYPCNGLFLCTDKNVKGEFLESYDYDVLESKFPEPLKHFDGNVTGNQSMYMRERQLINQTFNGILLGHISSKGGCVMGRKDNIIKCNGYNPNFNGWGYEDDEFPSRVHILGYTVGRLSGVNRPCWHLYHFDGNGSKKETQEFYNDNNVEANRVENMSKEELIQYKDTWIL